MKHPGKKNLCVFVQFCLVAQSCPTLCDPWTPAHQASLPITNSRSLLKLLSIKSMMPSNHLIVCHPLLLLPSILPSIRVFSNELALGIRWPVYWSFLSHYFCPIFYDFSKVTQPLECLRNKHLCFLYL